MLKTSKYITDIRFWIILFCIIRLYGINLPPLEMANNWRQTTVTMVARNFVETNNNIFFPRIDIAGDKTGITGMEFPLLNYIIYLVSIVFGYDHWYGRLINLIISSFGLYFSYLLVRKYFSEKTAFNSTIILLFSLWFCYSRKIMPDTISMSLIIGGLYFGTNYLEKIGNSKINIVLTFLFILTGALTKLPSVYLLFLFSVFYLKKEIRLTEKAILSFIITFAGILTAIWYFYWVPYLVSEYGLWHFFMGKSFVVGFNEVVSELGRSLNNFYQNTLKFIGFAAFSGGLIYAIIKRNTKVITIFIITFLSFLYVVFKSGITFPYHSYYMIPFAPVMAFIAGYGISQIKKQYIQTILLCAIAIEGVLNQIDDFRIPDKQMALFSLENDLDKYSDRNDLILINCGDYPTPMYFAHRKGWIKYNDFISNNNNIEKLRKKGLKKHCNTKTY